MNEVLRQEKKFLISVEQMYQYSQYLQEIMIQDPHNGAEGYTVRSLYFDTLENRDFMEKEDGVELRRKIRLRCYQPADDFAMLEMKQKEGPYQRKRSLPLKREDGQKLLQGDYSPLLQFSEAFAAECYGLMNRMCYRPKAVVEYRRKAFVARENRIRITIDKDMTATESCFDIFSENLIQYPVWDAFHAVLEVKYNGFLPSYIKELVSSVNCSEISVSKYGLSRSVGLHST